MPPHPSCLWCSAIQWEPDGRSSTDIHSPLQVALSLIAEKESRRRSPALFFCLRPIVSFPQRLETENFGQDAARSYPHGKAAVLFPFDRAVNHFPLCSPWPYFATPSRMSGTPENLAPAAMPLPVRVSFFPVTISCPNRNARSERRFRWHRPGAGPW